MKGLTIFLLFYKLTFAFAQCEFPLTYDCTNTNIWAGSSFSNSLAINLPGNSCLRYVDTIITTVGSGVFYPSWNFLAFTSDNGGYINIRSRIYCVSEDGSGVNRIVVNANCKFFYIEMDGSDSLYSTLGNRVDIAILEAYMLKLPCVTAR